MLHLMRLFLVKPCPYRWEANEWHASAARLWFSRSAMLRCSTHIIIRHTRDMFLCLKLHPCNQNQPGPPSQHANVSTYTLGSHGNSYCTLNPGALLSTNAVGGPAVHARIHPCRSVLYIYGHACIGTAAAHCARPGAPPTPSHAECPTTRAPLCLLPAGRHRITRRARGSPQSPS